MSLQLNTIQKDSSVKKNKRLGRGNASGKGTYCGKGQKGQRCRSGVSGLKRLGMKKILLRIPKKKGFNSHKPEVQTVNLSVVNQNFRNNDTVSPQTLFKKKLIDTPKRDVKILGSGKLTLEGIKFMNVGMSESVKKQVTKDKKTK